MQTFDWVELDKAQWFARRELGKMDAWPFNHGRIRNVLNMLLEMLKGRVSLDDADIVEIGASHHQPFGNGILCLLMGARSIRAMDFGDLVDPSRTAFGLYELLANCLAMPDRWNLLGIPDKDFIARVRAMPLAELEQGDMSSILGHRRPLQYFSYETSKTRLGPQSADLICSVSVYEHIRDLEHELRWHRVLLRPGGHAMHTIDFRDHRHYVWGHFDPWSYMVDGGYGSGSEAAGVRADHWINGLQLSQMLEVMERTGWEVVDVRRDVVDAPPEHARAQFRSEFSAMDDDDIHTLAVRVLLRAP